MPAIIGVGCYTDGFAKSMKPVIIVGSGQAGAQTAISLRQGNYAGPIILIGEEPGVPYHRPPLSKDFLKGDSRDRSIRQADFFAENDIQFLDNSRVVSVDRENAQVILEKGLSLDYDHLVLATGTRNRTLPIAGADLADVYGLRTDQDALALAERLKTTEKLVLIGGGFIGLEIASVARGLGKEVTVLEAAPRLMARVVSEHVSEHFLKYHRANNITIELNAMAAEISDSGSGSPSSVRLTDGREIECDTVIFCVGVVPNTELASAAGLDVANGIVVDEQLLTSDPKISAIGDCAQFPHRATARLLRLESVPNAVDQAKCVAARLIGNTETYDTVAWFWSDQGDQKLQIAGITDHANHWVRRSAEDGKLSVFCFLDEKFLGVETVNAATDHMAGRKVLSLGRAVSLRELEAADFSLRSLMR